MAWVYLDDQFPDHPKVVAAGDAAGWMFVCGLAYCRRYNTNGRIPKAQVAKLTGHRSPAKLAAKLVEAPAGYEHGLWEDRGDHYMVHDYDEWNRPQKSRSDAGKKAAQARWSRDANRNANASQTHSETDSDSPTNAVRDPVPQDALARGSLSLTPTDVVTPSSGLTPRATPTRQEEGSETLVDQAIRLASERYARQQMDAGQGKSASGLARWWIQEHAAGARERAVELLETHDLSASQLAGALLGTSNPTLLNALRKRNDEAPEPTPDPAKVQAIQDGIRQRLRPQVPDTGESA